MAKKECLGSLWLWLPWWFNGSFGSVLYGWHSAHDFEEGLDISHNFIMLKQTHAIKAEATLVICFMCCV